MSSELSGAALAPPPVIVDDMLRDDDTVKRGQPGQATDYGCERKYWEAAAADWDCVGGSMEQELERSIGSGV